MRCPVCRAQVEQGPNCRRCRADLSLLFRLENQRQLAVAEAKQAAAAGQYRRALALSVRAEVLRRGADVGQLRAAVYLLQRNFDQAWRSYLACHGPARDGR